MERIIAQTSWNLNMLPCSMELQKSFCNICSTFIAPFNRCFCCGHKKRFQSLLRYIAEAIQRCILTNTRNDVGHDVKTLEVRLQVALDV
ncbi:MAG: hypothetical protein K2N12_01780 [Helicobacter sp.]|nr:hypothetical protein [Helicobacter sp.]